MILSRTAKSCGLGAPTLALSPQRCFRILRATVARKPGSPERARRKPLKPLRREGRVLSAEPVVRTACFFIARGPWVPAGTRSSLRPLLLGGQCLGITRTRSAPREGEGVLHRQFEDFVGWAKRSVPTITRRGSRWWARRKCAFAHPTNYRATILATTSRDNEHRERALRCDARPSPTAVRRRGRTRRR